jgi:guanyl-specific ribonuclease Sa
MQTERNEIGPGSGRRARPLPLWQSILLLALVAGVYWINRERQPGLDQPPSERPTIGRPPLERPADQRKTRELNAPADRIEISGKPQNGTPRAERRTERPPTGTPQSGKTDVNATVDVPNVVVRDRDGKVAWRGTVDLSKTIARIEAGERLRFSNDGSVFENRERRLPRKISGYYHEYVHPTPGLSGPGPQRVIVGAGGEIYYTADHYRSFTSIRGP